MTAMKKLFLISLLSAFCYSSDNEISIKIFDSLGKEIMTALNPERQIQGKHNLPVNIAELPAGIYYYHFIVNNYRVNGKIIKL